jgi:hypothetical protein
MQSTIHENFDRDDSPEPGTERGFAIVLAAACAIAASINLWHQGRWWPWLAGVAVLFLATGWLRPGILKPLNLLWFKFGLLLHRVITPLVMGLLFFVTVWPTGLVMRAFGQDLLRLRREPEAESYWIVRKPPGPAPESMKDQF